MVEFAAESNMSSETEIEKGWRAHDIEQQAIDALEELGGQTDRKTFEGMLEEKGLNADPLTTRLVQTGKIEQITPAEDGAQKRIDIPKDQITLKLPEEEVEPQLP